tara:strand:+ start:821 stop:970 length:150 start_codon:yes stop_codon:yes gene_type:complete
VSSAELTPPPKDRGDELCIICDKPIRDHSFEEQKRCATKLSWTKKDKRE